MNCIRLKLAICVCWLLSATLAYAADGVDWTMRVDPVHAAGQDTAVVGMRWTMGSVSQDIIIRLQLDTQTDMKRGNWHGNIQSKERFYAKVYIIDETGKTYNLKLEHGQAMGPDAEFGIWKKGPATVTTQRLQFDLTRDTVIALKSAKSLMIKYASFGSPDDWRDIVFPMESFPARLSELDQSIRTEGGRAYLLTQAEIEEMPMDDLPVSIQEKMRPAVEQVSKELSIPIARLMPLSINQIKTKVDDKQAADRDAALAEKRAEYQAVYDQQPDWLDLNVCPKPDVSFCNNLGQEAYTHDILLGGDYRYGRVEGVVWRSKGSIVYIYGGVVEYDIEPEISRASSSGYYYIIKDDDGDLSVRSCDSTLLR